jgi:hypothetical protein
MQYNDYKLTDKKLSFIMKCVVYFKKGHNIISIKHRTVPHLSNHLSHI